MRNLALASGLLGGAVWVLRWLVDGPAYLHWVGLALVGAALVVAGARLTGSDVLPLRVVVALGLPLLVLSVLELVRPATGAASYDAAVGAVVVLVAGGWLLVGPGRPAPPGRRRAG